MASFSFDCSKPCPLEVGPTPETRWASRFSPLDPLWQARPDSARSRKTVQGRALSLTAPLRRLLKGERRDSPIDNAFPDRSSDPVLLLAYPADGEGRAILVPVDPVALLLRHRDDVERLRTAVGSRELFDTHVRPLLIGWAAAVQSLPRDARGLWSGADGFFEAGLAFARGALNALDAHVLEPELTPTARARWTDRMRVAAVAAGLMSDAPKLASVRLEAGTVSRSEGGFHRLETWGMGEETALAFGVRNAGRWMRLTRLTPAERGAGLSTLGLDLLRALTPKETLLWLDGFERDNGETVLSALKSAIMFGTGRSESERLLALSVARGREWAVNRRAARAARREGREPLLEGFGEVFRQVLLQQIESRHWTLNGPASPLCWAEDGLFLRWPEGFADLVARAGEGSAFRDIPEEPDAALQSLAAAEVLVPDEAGEVLVRTRGDEEGSLTDRGGSSWVRLAEEEIIVTLAKTVAAERGEALPVKYAPLAAPCLAKKGLRAASTRAKPSGDQERHPTRFEWRIHRPGTGSLGREGALPALERALKRLNRRPDAVCFGSVRGLFIPESFFPDDFRADDPAVEPLLLRRAAAGASSVVRSRQPFQRRVRFKGRAADSLSDLWKGGKPRASDEGEPLVLEGWIVNPLAVEPVEVWPDGTLVQRSYPATDAWIDFLDTERFVGDDDWRREDLTERTAPETPWWL